MTTNGDTHIPSHKNLVHFEKCDNMNSKTSDTSTLSFVRESSKKDAVSPGCVWRMI